MPESFCCFGGPHRNRTYNLLIKSQVLCLVELVAPHFAYINDRKSLVASLPPDVNFFLGKNGCRTSGFPFGINLVNYIIRASLNLVINPADIGPDNAQHNQNKTGQEIDPHNHCCQSRIVDRRITENFEVKNSMNNKECT